MLSTKRVVAALSLLVVAGCGGEPRIDASSDYALESSIATIKRSLSEKEKQEFDVDCTVAIFKDAMNTKKGKVPLSISLFSKLHGETAKGVHTKANMVRDDLKMSLNSTRSSESASSNTESPKADRPGDVGPSPPSKPVLPKPVVGLVKPPAPNLVPDTAWVAKPGDTATLFDKAGGMIYICYDRAAIGVFAKATLSKDQAPLDGLLVKGRANLAENGTSVVVTHRHDDPSIAEGLPVVEVNLVQGAYMGRSAWVAAASVVSLIDPTLIVAKQEAKQGPGPGEKTKSQPQPQPQPQPGTEVPPSAPAKAKAKSKAKPVDDATKAQMAYDNGMTMEDTGKGDRALKIYRDLVRDYPNTPSATKAKDRIDALTGKPRKK